MMLTFCRSVGEIDRNLQLKSNNLAEYCMAEIKFKSCYYINIIVQGTWSVNNNKWYNFALNVLGHISSRSGL